MNVFVDFKTLLAYFLYPLLGLKQNGYKLLRSKVWTSIYIPPTELNFHEGGRPSVVYLKFYHGSTPFF